MTTPSAKKVFNGVVKRKTLNAGSKNEHSAIVLKTATQTFKLNLKGDNPFENKGLAHLVDSTVKIEGRTMGSTLFIQDKADIQVINPPPRPAPKGWPKQ